MRPGQTAPATDIRVFLNPIIVCVRPDSRLVANTPVRIVLMDMAKVGCTLDGHTDEAGTVILDRFESGSFRIAPNGLFASGTFRCSLDGVFHAPLDPSGEYHVRVRADGINQVSVSQKPLTLAKGRTTDFGTVRLVRAGGFVLGRVVDSSGKPMAGVLAAVNSEKTLVSAALTDGQGRWGY